MELKQQQIPLSVKQQIDNLKALNLTIQDEKLATNFLNDISYFRFIKAYSLGLKPKMEIITQEQPLNNLWNCISLTATSGSSSFRSLKKLKSTCVVASQIIFPLFMVYLVIKTRIIFQ